MNKIGNLGDAKLMSKLFHGTQLKNLSGPNKS